MREREGEGDLSELHGGVCTGPGRNETWNQVH